jgi:hypothetical protein
MNITDLLWQNQRMESRAEFMNRHPCHGLFLNHHFSPFGRYNAFVLDADAPFVHATVDERNAKR